MNTLGSTHLCRIKLFGVMAVLTVVIIMMMIHRLDISVIPILKTPLAIGDSPSIMKRSSQKQVGTFLFDTRHKNVDGERCRGI